MIETVERWYAVLIAAASGLRSPFLLLIRLYWGWQFAQSGWGHLAHLDKVIGYFDSLGVPLPGLMAPAISVLEFIGGLFLIVGLMSRLMAFLLACDMIVAFMMSDREALMSIISDPDKFYAATPYTFLFASLLILIFGPGRYCLDTMLAKWFVPAAQVPAASAAH